MNLHVESESGHMHAGTCVYPEPSSLVCFVVVWAMGNNNSHARGCGLFTRPCVQRETSLEASSWKRRAILTRPRLHTVIPAVWKEL